MANLEAELRQLAERLQEHSESISTEEAAKTSIVLPFLKILGFDVFDPGEVIPEFTADAVGKKGEKVDYAIAIDGEVCILIECKGLSTKLESKHLSQLYRYFSVTSSRFAVLTNGQDFQFYSDLEEPNKLDRKPFFTFDLLDFSQRSAAELEKFSKSAFDPDNILRNAERLKYVSSIKRFISSQMEDPSADFVKVVAASVHDGRLTATVRENITAATKTAFNEFIREAVQARLSSALQSTGETDESADDESDAGGDGIVTTQDEIEGMLTIKSIVRDILAADRVGLRDAKSYCAVLVDDNNRKPLARMHFNRKQWYLGLFDTDGEERVPIAGLAEIYDHADRLRETAKKYVE